MRAARGHPPATPSAPSAATHAPDEGTTLARSTPCMFQRHSCHSPAPWLGVGRGRGSGWIRLRLRVHVGVGVGVSWGERWPRRAACPMRTSRVRARCAAVQQLRAARALAPTRRTRGTRPSPRRGGARRAESSPRAARGRLAAQEAAPGWAKAEKWAACSSSRGGGWAPSEPGLCPGSTETLRATRRALTLRGSRAGSLPIGHFDHAAAPPCLKARVMLCWPCLKTCSTLRWWAGHR